MKNKFAITIPLAIIGLFTFIIIQSLPVIKGEIDLAEAEFGPTISKEKAEAAARQYIEHQFEVATEAAFVMFQTERNLAGYLQKEQLAESYQHQYLENYPIDYYLVQIDTVDDTSYFVRVHMQSGEMIGFEKSQTSSDQLTSQSQETANQFLIDLGYNLEHFTIRSPGTKRYQLLYESRQHKIGEASLQLHLSVEEGRVTAFTPQFAVPDSFIQWLNDQNQSASRMSLFSILFSLFVGVAALITAIIYRGSISFKHGVWLTMIYLITASIHNFNLYPGLKSQMAGAPESEFAILFTIAFSHLFTFFTAAAVYLALTSGDALWHSFGRKLWTHWQDKTFPARVIHAMAHGYLLCFMLLGLQSVMFLIAEEKFQVWSINDALFSNYNLLIPALFPLMAWAAAISEEAIYRLFGIALFKKFVRSTTVAVFLTSMIWAIGHTSYPIYPAYTRFVEVTILGLVFGWIMLRFGFLTAIYTHATFDSILMAFSIMALGGTLNSLLGVVYIASPVLAALILAQLHRWRRPLPHSS